MFGTIYLRLRLYFPLPVLNFLILIIPWVQRDKRDKVGYLEAVYTCI